MKPTGRIAFVFDTGLVICLRDDIEDGELKVSFEESLSLQLVAKRIHSLLLLATQTQKEHFIEDLSLRLFVNTLTADEKHYLLNQDNLTQPIQLQLSQKQKSFAEFFFAISKSILN